jgi:CHAT domain-containing protein
LSQSSPDFESRKRAAYQKFHRGQTRDAAKEIAQLVREATDKNSRARLLRDLTEICATAYELNCTLEAETAAFEIAKSDETLKPLIPELYSYFIQANVWSNNAEAEKVIFKDDRVRFNPVATPFPSAIANLAAVVYFLRSDNHRLAEKSYSTALLSLLLIDPKDTYSVCKVLTELLESLTVQQDIVGARSLAHLIDPYMNAKLSHEGALFGRYIYLSTQLVAMTARSRQIAPALEDSITLNDRLDINDGVKLYRTSTSNSLASLSLLFDGTVEEAAAVHSRHPLQTRRNEIINRGHFETLQEFFFAISDLLVQDLKEPSKNADWKPLFDQLPVSWQLTGFSAENIESYRHFAQGIITYRSSRSEGALLFQTAARERIKVFEEFLTQRFEGFQLPSTIDLLVIETALTSLAESPPADASDLALKGSEMLSRTLRHQTSDFAVLIGSQKTERSRANARSYYLLIQQKRRWELDQIKTLIEGKKADAGYAITTYSNLVESISKLEDSLSRDDNYTKAIGYPNVAQLQSTLASNEAFVTYFPTFKGFGRLCISKSNSMLSVSDINPLQAVQDAKLIRLALTQERAADEDLDSEYPAISAVRLNEFLFKGIESCTPAGSLVNISLPEELSGIPLAALLQEEPPRRGGGYDLLAAKWLGATYSFASAISARHFMGSRASIAYQRAQLPYLGVGDPVLTTSVADVVSAAAELDVSMRSSISTLAALPETADEILKVRELLDASKGEVLLGSDATEENLRSKDLGKYDVIHFATHGLLKDDIPGLTEAALVLTPADFLDSFDDGLLTVSEITRLSFGARLVVLSACNTAHIDTSVANVGIADLQAAFSVAGSPTLLAALWTIDSNSAHDVILEFFRSWKDQENKSAAKALSDGVRAYLRRADRAHHHPRFWAPFIVFGYGASLPSNPPPIAVDLNFQVIPGAKAGEILDAKALSNDLILSMLGDWDGQTMASIITDASDGRFRTMTESHQIGAGSILINNSQAYAIGYRTSAHPFPILRRFDRRGLIIWEKHWEDLIDYTPAAAVLNGDKITLVINSSSNSDKHARAFILISVDPNGNETKRETISVGASAFIIGKTALLSRFGDQIVLAVNSRQFGNFAQKEILFGLSTLCKGPVESTIYLLDPSTFEIRNQLNLKDFQVSAVEGGGQDIYLGGESRNSCDDGGNASAFKVSPNLTAQQIWKDDDQFPSSIQALKTLGDGMIFSVKRERPIGARRLGSKAPDLTKKRWGDNDEQLMEFSILRVNADGISASEYNSTFGLGAFTQGIFLLQDRPIVFGSLGGRPAISDTR